MTDTPAWSTTPMSDNRMNLMTNIKNTGGYLTALDKTKYGIVICTADGGGLLKDHVYLCNAAGDAFIDISSVEAHNHYSDAQGGKFVNVLTANSAVIDLLLSKTDDLKQAQWNVASPISGSTVEDSTDGTTGERSIRLRTNTTSGGSPTITYPHLELDFSEVSNFTCKLQIETATNVALHAGLQADLVTAADSNTRKVQAEVCTVTNNNWWLRTATGSANSASDSGIAISANRVGVGIGTFPTAGTPHSDLLIDVNTAFQKTSNIPIDGSTADNNLLRFSVKNSTAADRPLKMYACRVSYFTFDNWIV